MRGVVRTLRISFFDELASQRYYLLKEKFLKTAIVQLKYGCYGMIYAVGI